MAGLIGVGVMVKADDAMAMNYHVQGDRIFLSGGVTFADVVSLPGVIRTSGLNTIVSGDCISSCSIMQSGGKEDYLAGDLPIVDSAEIHAGNNGDIGSASRHRA